MFVTAKGENKERSRHELYSGSVLPSAGVVQAPTASTSPASLLEMQILRLLPRPAESQAAGMEPRNNFTSSLGDSGALWCLRRTAFKFAATLKFPVRILPPSYELRGFDPSYNGVREGTEKCI